MPKVPKIRSLHIFAISPVKHGGWSCFLPANKHEGFLQVDSITLGLFSEACPKYSKQVYNIFVISQGKCEGWTWSFSYRLAPKVSSNCYYHFRCVCPGMLKLPKITSLLFLCNILRKNWVMKLIFCMQVSMKACYKLIVCRWSRIPKVSKIASLQCLYSISKKEVKAEVDFLHAEFPRSLFQHFEHQSFLQGWYYHY